MTIGINDLKKAIEFGSDIEFNYKDKSYTILPWTEDGIVIGPQNEDNDMVFKTADELIDGYMLDGKSIREVIDTIDILII